MAPRLQQQAYALGLNTGNTLDIFTEEYTVILKRRSHSYVAFAERERL